ncbi:hypothetical protein NDN13_11045 [Acinetobacter sp. C32I]|uniref:hypothetical protein n=1 Tax=Acinetobacter sp. C32I TaxID=2950074 RepID=UPI0020372367|nr:hypothetical protein [Acinetobacter sp. C32I]USA52031.1 hypothetical protein NDN13_11045 [Acinetobacter sp. C32I]
MYLHLPRIYRQIALVSYGNEFLTGGVDSELLDRHPLLFTHFPILRNIEQGNLLAGSASHFLSFLKSQGLEKISLHSASNLSNYLNESELFNFTQGDSDFCIVCHFPQQQLKALIHCEEKSLWQSYDNDGYPLYSDYNNYHDSVENYVLIDLPVVAISSITEDLKPISWQSFFNEYQEKIYHFAVARRFGSYPVPLTDNNCYEGDMYQIEEQFPVLPYNLKKNYASILMLNAARLKSQFDNESHIKNDNGDYWHMSETEKLEFDTARNTLEEFHILILKYTANQYQNSNISHQHDQHNAFKFSPKSLDTIEFSSTPPPLAEHETSSFTEPQPHFHWSGIIKFLWSMLWCYCALWTLAYFAVDWGNLFILILAFIYAIYKVLKKLANEKDH